MTQQEFNNETESDNDSVRKSVTISNNASAVAAAALADAESAATSIPLLQPRLEAARDVAEAFQQAVAACVKLQALKSSTSTEENKNPHDESDTSIKSLDTRLADTQARNQTLKSNEKVNAAFVAAKSAVDSAHEKIRKVHRATGEFTREDVVVVYY
jgi:hypothetical protein